MQEWIIAMLVISVLLVLRDMAKVFFRGRSFLKAEQPAEEKNPQKEKVERYAASFRKLADSFYGLQGMRPELRSVVWRLITLPKRLFKQRPGGWNHKGDL